MIIRTRVVTATSRVSWCSDARSSGDAAKLTVCEIPVAPQALEVAEVRVPRRRISRRDRSPWAMTTGGTRGGGGHGGANAPPPPVRGFAPPLAPPVRMGFFFFFFFFFTFFFFFFFFFFFCTYVVSHTSHQSKINISIFCNISFYK